MIAVQVIYYGINCKPDRNGATSDWEKIDEIPLIEEIWYNISVLKDWRWL